MVRPYNRSMVKPETLHGAAAEGRRYGSRSGSVASQQSRGCDAELRDPRLAHVSFPPPRFHGHKQHWCSVPRCARLGRARHHRLRR